MIVTFHKGVFVADYPDEQGLLKKTGFKLHEQTLCHLKGEKCKACRADIGRRWWSANIWDAARLEKFLNDKALQVTREYRKKFLDSRATSAEFVVPSPDGLTYLPFQLACIKFICNFKDFLIADDMGLGKSIESLGFINHVRPKSVIVVCPATLIFNWRNEAEKWLVDKTFEFVEIESRRQTLPDDEHLFVIVNYEKLTMDSPLTRSLNARQWDIMIVDEAQYIKNPTSKRALAVIGREGLMRRAHRCAFLTGTPIENRPREIWPILSAISPSRFGDKIAFEERYCGRHQEMRNGEWTWVADGATNLGELHYRARTSGMMRRTKDEVLKEVPPKRRQLIILKDPKKDWSKDPRFQRWQAMFDKEFEQISARLEATKTGTEYKETAMSMEKISGIPFTEMSEMRHQVALAKLPMCLSYIDQTLQSVDKLVIFAHHRDVIEKIAKHLGNDAVVVHGQTPHKGPNSREAAVADFQSGKKRIFVGQIRAAGVGLTLTAANTVIFVEIDWVPGVLSQCEDRLCRIGQKKMVHVIHPVLAGTLEINMLQKLIAKQNIIDKALDRNPMPKWATA